MSCARGIRQVILLPVVPEVTTLWGWIRLSVVQPAMPVGRHLRCLDHAVIANIATWRLARARLAFLVITIAELVGPDEPRLEMEM